MPCASLPRGRHRASSSLIPWMAKTDWDWVRSFLTPSGAESGCSGGQDAGSQP
jgi:hypothetical protein